MDRDQRLREIRERVEKFDSVDWGEKEEAQAALCSHAREDVPWLLAEVERLRDEQRRADELEGIAKDARIKIDRYKELSGIVQGERTEEQQSELWTLAQEMRHWDEAEGLRGQLKRVQAELDETKQVLSAQSKILATQAKELTEWEHRWKAAQSNEIAHGTDLERRLGEMGYFPPDPSGEGYVSAMAHCELGLFAAIELRKARERLELENSPLDRLISLNGKLNKENRDLRERLEILECHDEDTRGRLRPDVLKDPPPPGCGVWVSKVQLVNKGAFDYPGSCVDG